MAKYVPGTPVSGLGGLSSPGSSSGEVYQLYLFLSQELAAIAQAIQEKDSLLFVPLTAEPEKLREGLTVLADGTIWDPGSGKGVYTYYDSAWHKLG